MKRTKTTPAKSQARNTRALDARRLTTVRGGADLGITITVYSVLPPDMQNQHNETLVRY